MNNNLRALGILVQGITIIILLIIDWRIAICVFFWEWGGNMLNKADLNNEVESLKYQIDYANNGINTLRSNIDKLNKNISTELKNVTANTIAKK